MSISSPLWEYNFDTLAATLSTAFIFSGSLSLICSASLCFSPAPAQASASGSSNRAAKSVRSIMDASRLLDLGLAVFDVLPGDRVVFFLFHLIGLGARVLPRHIVVTSAGGGDQLDLETDGFGHGLYPLN